MDDPRIERALQTARRALEALAGGDDAAFALAWAEHEADCLAIEGVSQRELPALDELVAIDTTIAHALEAALAETSGRMAMLRRGGRTHAAYAASIRLV
ncbi:MAG: hypothetical protein AMXMBFR80_28080 [Dehalococcoidia bacterium]|mgnify:CR=1 FL=1|jgi:hypothetical protein|nr:hypothetical protein [Tepidiformaceae bacterium]